MSVSSPRVVVTGLGVASPLGVGRKAFAEGLASGRCAIEELDGRLSLVAPGAGALVDVPRKEFRNYFDTRLLRLSTMTRQTTLGCIACGTLLEDADCPPNGESYADRGAYLGSFIVPPDFAKQARAASKEVLSRLKLSESIDMCFLRCRPVQWTLRIPWRRTLKA